MTFNSPAHLAASKGLTEALEVLVKYQGSLELRNNDGDLPIHEAALFQQHGKGSFPLIAKANSQARCENFHPITAFERIVAVSLRVACESLASWLLRCVEKRLKFMYRFAFAKVCIRSKFV